METPSTINGTEQINAHGGNVTEWQIGNVLGILVERNPGMHHGKSTKTGEAIPGLAETLGLDLL